MTARPDPAGDTPAGTAGEPAGVAVRALTAADLPDLVTLEDELFGAGAWTGAMLDAELTGPGRWYAGVDDAAGLAGYVGLWFDGEVAQVMTLGVATRAQRRGLGRVLLGALVDRARQLGARAVMLEVRVDNDPALELYRGAGFEVLARRRRYYQPEDVDAFTMALTLGP
ncbi:ribosomal protein S18-alanine N-acetyltransferase [Cellulomonas bogoriensis]|uniref:Alanine acetyltransferase n=1 Tax=Cellulomonas bogoriensis 69B4 = DSM 16987 TaxID=1386082 RepID=A0A0A0BU57_9CELL|nr:ribosomal protein S18-alanine N-acetyltransferase [Cellulomonas bogoriensis]KGM10664.1 alanine acetyltransferase [Cellulomonas bogoriensis 69B4 = DSM 16987]